MSKISIPQQTFQDFRATRPLLAKKLIRWAGLPRGHYHPNVTAKLAEEFVERYVTELLLPGPSDKLQGKAVLDVWHKQLSAIERHQISRLFGLNHQTVAVESEWRPWELVDDQNIWDSSLAVHGDF